MNFSLSEYYETVTGRAVNIFVYALTVRLTEESTFRALACQHNGSRLYHHVLTFTGLFLKFDKHSPLSYYTAVFDYFAYGVTSRSSYYYPAHVWWSEPANAFTNNSLSSIMAIPVYANVNWTYPSV